MPAEKARFFWVFSEPPASYGKTCRVNTATTGDLNHSLTTPA
jgi:hypothetical protein